MMMPGIQATQPVEQAARETVESAEEIVDAKPAMMATVDTAPVEESADVVEETRSVSEAEDMMDTSTATVVEHASVEEEPAAMDTSVPVDDVAPVETSVEIEQSTTAVVEAEEELAHDVAEPELNDKQERAIEVFNSFLHATQVRRPRNVLSPGCSFAHVA
jgi:type IV secretory pathway VirB10-like protein